MRALCGWSIFASSVLAAVAVVAAVEDRIGVGEWAGAATGAGVEVGVEFGFDFEDREGEVRWGSFGARHGVVHRTSSPSDSDSR